ncbi:MAG: acyltransferase [Planctomycetota bacterium]|nr:acyltransferase [Planctomycetota bacterium]
MADQSPVDASRGLSGASLPTIGARKRSLSKPARALRLVLSAIDPRAYAHLFRMINFYNHTHVIPRRAAAIHPSAAVSPDAMFSHGERIEIARGARIGSRCCIWAGPSRARVVIGENALFGPEVMITAAGYRFNDGSPVTDQRMDEADVIIGRDVWLATRVIVLPGVTIGDGAIVGAGAVVTKSVEPGAIVVGAPARVVGQRRIVAASGSVGEAR